MELLNSRSRVVPGRLRPDSYLDDTSFPACCEHLQCQTTLTATLCVGAGVPGLFSRQRTNARCNDTCSSWLGVQMHIRAPHGSCCACLGLILCNEDMCIRSNGHCSWALQRFLPPILYTLKADCTESPSHFVQPAIRQWVNLSFKYPRTERSMAVTYSHRY